MVAEQIEQNKQGWNAVAHHFHGVDAIPRYGLFTQKEEELGLFGDVRDKKVPAAEVVIPCIICVKREQVSCRE